MNALQQFLQSASNAAASNVSGPVDLIAAGLRKLGVPVPQNALMSSQWMEEQGLTRKVPQNALSLAGETLGMVAPIAAAAKAPQIAAAMNQAGANLAAPKTLNPQTGAIVWHGSPHKFDKFDSSKIGTGEGAQAYGHGLYLADSSDVAKIYRDQLAPQAIAKDPQWNAVARKGEALANRASETLGVSDLQTLRQMINDGEEVPAKYANALRQYDARILAAAQSARENASNLYKVDLPDAAISRMLDWDKPLSQQAPEVRKSLMTTLQKSLKPYRAVDGSTRYMATIGGQQRAFASEADAMAALSSELDGASAYLLSGGGSQSSNQLARQGIPGIRFLDGNSRGAGAGTYNYVVFPGEENMLRILERNGQPLR